MTDDDNCGDKHNIFTVVVINTRMTLIQPRPTCLPLSLPEDMGPELSQLHSNPAAWFFGQFIFYLLRFSEEMKHLLRKTVTDQKLKSPMVGIHVRRTDKIQSSKDRQAEAKFYPVENYMFHLEKWFKLRDPSHQSIPRRVFIATDAPSVIDEAKLKFKRFQIFGNNSIAQSASGNRLQKSGLQGIVNDIYFLSQCDYVVCTFSSNVCRIAFEIMQVVGGNVTGKVKSLDAGFEIIGQQGPMKYVKFPKGNEPN